MAIDWAWLEELVVKHATKAIEDLAAAHPEDTFYGAIFFVEPFDGIALELLLNTEEHLLAEVGAANARIPHYRFLPTNFLYTLDLDGEIEQWPDISEAIFEATEDDMDANRHTADGELLTTARFLEAIVHAAVRLEHTALAQLRRTPDFAIAITPSAVEAGDLALARYARLKSR